MPVSQHHRGQSGIQGGRSKLAENTSLSEVITRTQVWLQSDLSSISAQASMHEAVSRDRLYPWNASLHRHMSAITIHIFTLGQFTVRLSGHLNAREAIWPNRQTRQLLWHLLTSPGYSCAREQLIEKFWPGATLQQGRVYLRQALSRLKRVLDPLQRPYGRSSFLQSDRETVRLMATPTDIPYELHAHPVGYRSYQASEQPGVWLDIAQFHDLATAALPVLDVAIDADGHVAVSSGRVVTARIAAERAVALYHGDFLPFERYDEDVERTRQNYHRMWRALVHYLIYFALAEHRYHRASLLLGSLLDMDPGDEDAAASLIHVQWAAGYREDACKTYQRVVGYLNNALAVGPSPRLKTLYRALCSGEEAPPF